MLTGARVIRPSACRVGFSLSFNYVPVLFARIHSWSTTPIEVVRCHKIIQTERTVWVVAKPGSTSRTKHDFDTYTLCDGLMGDCRKLSAAARCIPLKIIKV